jgi:hypothetical protein
MNPNEEEILQLLDATGYPESMIKSLKQDDVLEATVRFGPGLHILAKGKDLDDLVARLISIYVGRGMPLYRARDLVAHGRDRLAGCYATS